MTLQDESPSWDLTKTPTAELLDQLHEFAQAHAAVADSASYSHPRAPHYAAHFYNLRWSVARELERRGLKDNILPLLTKGLQDAVGLGMVPIQPLRFLTKAVQLGAGERWITVHPHGKDEPGVPVMIRDRGDGTASIVGGAGGSLNFVKLTNLKTPEQYREQAKGQAKERREKEKDRLAQMSPEEKELERAAKSGIEDRKREKQIEVINRVYQAMGAEPPKFMPVEEIVGATGLDEAAAKIARAREIKAHLAAVNHAVKLAREMALNDHEAAAAAGLGEISLGQTQDKDLFGEERLGMDLLEPDKTSEHAGISSDYKKKAAERGVTEEQIKTEKKLVTERSHQEIDEKRQEFSHKMSTMMQSWNKQAKEIEEAGLVKQGILKPEKLPEPEKILEILKAKKELDQTLQKAKKAKQDVEAGNLKVQPFVVDTSDQVAADVVKEFKDEVSVRAVRALLSRVDTEDGLTKHVRNGAFDTLNNAALTASANELVGREVMDFLGSAGTAQLLAARLKRNLSPEDYAATAEAVGQFHGKTNAEMANAALDKANEYQEAALQMEIDSVDNPTDLMSARTTNAQRMDLLEKARQIVGDCYGRVRAMGELSLAMQGAKGNEKEWTIDLGDLDKEQAITMARSFGLTPEIEDVQATQAEQDDADYVDKAKLGAKGQPDYRLDSAAGHSILTLYPSSLDKLVSAFDPKDTQEYQAVQAIKRGDQDEDGWLPAGIEKRPATTFDDPEYQVGRFDGQINLKDESTPEEMHGQMKDFIGSLFGEGYDFDDLRSNLYAPEFEKNRIPDHLVNEFRQMRDEEFFPLAKFTEEQEAGSASDKAQTLADRNKEIKEQAMKQAAEYSAEYKRKSGMTDEQLIALNTQRIPVKEAGEQITEAVHRTLSQIPAAKAAFTPLGKLDNDSRAILRDHYVRNIAKIAKSEGTSRDLSSKKPAKPQQQAQEQQHAGAAPEENGGMGLFGDEEDLGSGGGLKKDEWTENYLKEKGTSLEQIQAENKEKNADLTKRDKKAAGEAPEEEGEEFVTPESRAWNHYVKAMGGQQAAYETIQAMVQGDAAEAYATHHGRVFGRPLKLGKVRLPNWTNHLLSRLPADKLEEKLGAKAAEARSLMATLAKRSGGKFASEGEEGARRKAAARLQQIMRDSQLELFERDQFPSLDRPTIGQDAEAQLGSIWPKMTENFNRKQGQVKLIPDLSMSGDKVKQQRAVKLVLRNKRAALHMGAGSGKSIISIGAFTQLHDKGEAKKAVYAVPSSVQSQFGSEMLRFTTPGKYKWLADPSASREDRFAAYADDSTHMIVTTHQGFRDDLAHAIAQAHGMEPGQVAARFKAMGPEERQAAMKHAIDSLGWKVDSLVVDEAHNIVNRQGKEDSAMAELIDSFSGHMPNYMQLTGTPIKNDASEAFDVLKKLKPEKFTDRGAFMKKYGVNTPMSKASLQRLMGRYCYADKIASGVNRDTQVRTLPLSEKQQAEYSGVMQALNKVRSSRRSGNVDIEAVKQISPASFEGKPVEQHQEIANQRAKAGLGGLLSHRLNSICNSYDYEHNAKIHALRADLRADKGKPTVIFAHNYASIDQIKRLCKEEGLKFGVLSGKQSAGEKSKSRLKFNPDSQDAKAEHDVLICSDAGSTGMNLQRGSVLVNYDTPDTAMTHEQRCARIDRLGQTQDVTVRDYTTETPFERNARKRLDRKYGLADTFQSPSELLDDTGLAAEIQAVRAQKRNKQPQAA